MLRHGRPSGRRDMVLVSRPYLGHPGVATQLWCRDRDRSVGAQSARAAQRMPSARQQRQPAPTTWALYARPRRCARDWVLGVRTVHTTQF